VRGELRDVAIRRQGRLALAYLALHSDRPVSRDELVLAVWGDGAAGDHGAGLSSVLSRLRRVMGDAVITRAGSVQLAADVRVDYHEAMAELAGAREALQRGEAVAAASGALRAVQASDRGVLHGESAPWLEEWRRELTELGLRARECIAGAALQCAGPELPVAVNRAREVVRAEPFRESGHALLMRALAAQGDVAEALRIYEVLRRRLREELGAAPGTRLRALHDELLGVAPVDIRGPPLLPVATARTRAGFVGRAAELAVLRRAFAAAAVDGTQLLVLEGEPGIGKTRLALRFAQEAAERRGANVLYGRCDAETLMPYQPFVEALRRHVAASPVARLRAQIPVHVAELARVLPELAEPGTAAAETRDGEPGARSRLFEAIAALLADAAAARPVLLVLDDLHWADWGTLLMLRQVIRLTSELPLLVLGVHRDNERGDALRDTLADLRREHVFDRITLGGIGEDEAAALVRQAGESGLAGEVARTLWQESRGNPFFLEEMVRHRGASGERAATPASVPDAVKDVIGRRLAQLSSDVRQVLEIAGVAGGDFSLRVLEALSDLSEDTLDRALKDAIDARLIVELPDVADRFAFEHALTRQTLYEGLTRSRRARLHLRIGEALEQLRRSEDGAHLAELAHHFLLAPSERGAARAVDYSARAASHASDVLAYEDASGHYEAALSALDRVGDDGERRYELLLALGETQVKAGDTRHARVSFGMAGDIARGRGSAVGLARAALGFAKIAGGVVDEAMVDLLDEALEAVGDQHEVLRSRLLARLLIELSFSSGRERLVALSDEAVAVARRTGDPAALSPALIARHWSLWEPQNVAERLATSTELLSLAATAGDRKIELQGHRWRMMNLLEIGDVEGADAEIEAYAGLARERRLPAELWYVHLFRGLRRLMAGDYAEVRAQIEAGMELGRRVADTNAEQGFTIQLAGLRRDCGGLADVEGAVRANASRYFTIPGWRSLLAVILVETGRPDEAREQLEMGGRDSFTQIPMDGLWLGAINNFAEVSSALGDAERAATLYELLRPYPDRNVVMGWASACAGSSSRPLALLAAALGRRSDASRHFEDALVSNQRMGARPWVARVRIEYGQFLLGESDAGQRIRGRELLQRGLSDANRVGMKPSALAWPQAAASASS
jgi:DNA-binding SARP family transcriptional activator